MRKWREKSNVLMSYLKKFGIWIKMKKDKTNKPMYIRTKKDQIDVHFLGPYYAHILCTYIMYIMYVCSCVQ